MTRTILTVLVLAGAAWISHSAAAHAQGAPPTPPLASPRVYPPPLVYPPRPRSQPMVGMGYYLFILGGLTTTAGVTVLAMDQGTSRPEEKGMMTPLAVPLILGGLGLAAAGAPLVILGSKPAPPGPWPADVPPPGERRTGLLIAGITLVGFAALTAPIGAAMYVSGRSRGALGITGFVLMPNAALCAAVGLPMLIIGAMRSPGAPAAAAVPALLPGPRSLDLRWRF